MGRFLLAQFGVSKALESRVEELVATSSRLSTEIAHGKDTHVVSE